MLPSTCTAPINSVSLPRIPYIDLAACSDSRVALKHSNPTRYCGCPSLTLSARWARILLTVVLSTPYFLHAHSLLKKFQLQLFPPTPFRLCAKSVADRKESEQPQERNPHYNTEMDSKPSLGATFVPGGFNDDYYYPPEVISPVPQRYALAESFRNSRQEGYKLILRCKGLCLKCHLTCRKNSRISN